MIANQYSLFEPSQDEKLSCAERTLQMLQVAPRSTVELLKVGVRPAAYVRQLRMMGYIIESRKVDKVAVYSLVGLVETVEVTEEMKLAYYDTAHWSAKRLERMRFDGFSCRCCSDQSMLQVHHWKYDLFNEDLRDLLTVCEICHERIHSYENVHCHFPRYVSREIAQKLKVAVCV